MCLNLTPPSRQKNCTKAHSAQTPTRKQKLHSAFQNYSGDTPAFIIAAQVTEQEISPDSTVSGPALQDTDTALLIKSNCETFSLLCCASKGKYKPIFYTFSLASDTPYRAVSVFNHTHKHKIRLINRKGRNDRKVFGGEGDTDTETVKTGQ